LQTIQLKINLNNNFWLLLSLKIIQGINLNLLQ